MTKQQARKKYRKLRMSLTRDEVLLASKHICKALTSRLENIQTIHVFLPIKKLNEIDLSDFISSSLVQKKVICTSVSDFETQIMSTYRIDSFTQLEENAWGIPEPINALEMENDKIDAVIVPLLYADKQGNRIGYGKGFYDRFLSKCREDVLKIGVNYFSSNELIEDVQDTDVQIDELITFTPTN